MWYNIGLFLLLASFVERLQSKRGVMDNHLHINLIIFLIEGKRKAYLWLTLSNFIWFLWVSLYFKKPTLKFFTTFFIFFIIKSLWCWQLISSVHLPSSPFLCTLTPPKKGQTKAGTQFTVHVSSVALYHCVLFRSGSQPFVGLIGWQRFSPDTKFNFV